jgi:uncharacterized protein (TIGR01244 family)
MKPIIISLFFLFSINSVFSQITPADSVQTIDGFKNLYHYQNFYIAAQPSYEELQWLKDKGVGTIINLRSTKENQDFTTGSFNEESVAKQLGFNYYSIPVDGMKDHTPAKLEEMSHLLSDTPVLIHCASGGRATNFFMAYLVKNKGYTIDQAVAVGKKLSFSLPLENLLDMKITMEEAR